MDINVRFKTDLKQVNKQDAANANQVVIEEYCGKTYIKNNKVQKYFEKLFCCSLVAAFSEKGRKATPTKNNQELDIQWRKTPSFR